MSDCKAVGSLIVTMWKSAYFPPLLCGDDAHFNFFVRDWLFLSLCFNKSNLFIKGKAKNKLFGTSNLIGISGIQFTMLGASY